MAKKDFAISLRLQAQQFNTGIKAVQNQLSSFKAFATKAFVGLGVAEFGKNLIKAAANLQTLDTNLGTLLGSMEKGKNLRKQLQQYGEATPYDTKGLVTATQTMLGYGVQSEKVMDVMKQLGDIAMGDSNKLQSLALAYSQMTASGKVMKQDMNQMANAGFGFNQVAKSMGITVGELNERISKGKVSIDDISKALKQATSEGGLFFNAAKNGSSTFDGVMSNFEESVTNTMANVGNQILPTVTQIVQSLGSMIESLAPTITDIAQTIGSVLQFIVDNAKEIGVGILTVLSLPKLKDAWQTLSTTWKQVQDDIVAKAINTNTQIATIEKQELSYATQIKNTEEDLQTAKDNKIYADQVQLNQKLKILKDKQVAYEQLKNQQLLQNQRALILQTGSAGKKLGVTLSGIGTAMKAAFSSTVITAAITAVTMLITKFVGLYQEHKRILNISKEYEKQLKDVPYDESITRLEQIQRLIQNSKDKTKTLKGLQGELNSVYGISVTDSQGKLRNEEAITGEIRKQIELLKQKSRLDVANRVAGDATSKLEDLYAKYGITYRKGETEQGRFARFEEHLGNLSNQSTFTNLLGFSDYGNDLEKGRQLSKSKMAAQSQADDISEDIINKGQKNYTYHQQSYSPVGGGGSSKGGKSGNGGGSSTGGSTTNNQTDPITEARKNYIKAFNVATAKFKHNLITQDEYDDAITSAKEELINAYLENGKSIDKVKEVDEVIAAKKKKEADAIDKEIQSYQESAAKATRNAWYDKKHQIQPNYNDDLDADGVPDNDKNADDLAETNEKISETLQRIHEIEDMQEEIRKKGGEFPEQVKALNQLFDQTQNQLANLNEQAMSLNDKIRIAKIDESIKNTREEMQGSLPILNEFFKSDKASLYADNIIQCYDAVKDLGSAWASLGDKKGLNLVFGIIDNLLGTFQKINDIFESWKSMEKLFDKLSSLLGKKKDIQSGQDATKIDPTHAIVGSESPLIKSSGNTTPTSPYDIKTGALTGSTGNGSDSSFKEVTPISGNTGDTSGIMPTIPDPSENISNLEKMGKATEDFSNIKTTTTTANMAANTAQTVSDTTHATQSLANAGQEVESAGMTSAANIGKDVSKSKMPWYTKLAIIAGVITTVIGLFSAIKGSFASGGIIEGVHKHGDQQLARVNGGEMILNGNQQRHLFNALNSASLASPYSGGGQGNVVFRLRGQDLLGSINNYKNKMGIS